jgi:hypothetical protein
MKVAAALTLLACFGAAAAQPFLPGTGFAPLGNLRTTDQDGPYSLEYVPVQVAEVRAGLLARDGFTALDIIHFLTNVECLEGRFDTFGTFGFDFTGDLTLNGPTPKGLRKANLTERTRPFLEEVALNEQGHALLTRHLGSDLPCPFVDYDAGWNEWFAAAYNLPAGQTVEQKFGKPFDYALNEQNFVLCVLSLEETGARGNKGLTLLVDNPVHANAIAGLATSATAQATIERKLLWELKDEIIEPFGETAIQVFARVSALRDRLDGPQVDDQGLVNTDKRNIAVPDKWVNMIPTEVHGLTFAATPQQNINILTLGAKNGKGGFFPNGLLGKIRLPTGYNKVAPGTNAYPRCSGLTSPQEPTRCLGNIPPTVRAVGNTTTPKTVEGELQLTQALNGPLATPGPEFRGLRPTPPDGTPNTNGPPVKVAVSPCGRGKTPTKKHSHGSDDGHGGRKGL